MSFTVPSVSSIGRTPDLGQSFSQYGPPGWWNNIYLVSTMLNLSHDFDEKSDFLNYEFSILLPSITHFKNGLVQKRELAQERMWCHQQHNN